MGDPRISVIIPYFNAAAFIDAALASVRAQSPAPHEIIVVDDGSTDGIAWRARAWADVRLLQQENKGPAAAKNTGVRAAKGDIIAFLDADDMWPEGKLARQLARLEAAPEAGIVMGNSRAVYLDGAQEPAHAEAMAPRGLMQMHLGASLIRRFVFHVAGLFDETLRFSEDHDWLMRVRERDIPINLMPGVMLTYHRHADNMTGSKTLHDLQFMTMLKNSITRRKKQGAASDLPPLKIKNDAE
jgi:glycosyltransferase involved in cell wall biosynthesis